MTRAIEIEESVRVDRTPAAVWEAIADYGFDAAWREGLQEMTPDRPGQPVPGTRVREVIRSSGREYAADTVVTSVEPGTAYRFEGSGTLGRLGGGRAVTPDGDGGAVFTYRVELEPRGALRLLRPVLGRVVRSGLRRDLGTLKELLEARR